MAQRMRHITSLQIELVSGVYNSEHRVLKTRFCTHLALLHPLPQPLRPKYRLVTVNKKPNVFTRALSTNSVQKYVSLGAEYH